MFAGIIENQGRIIKKEKKGGQVRFGVRLKRIFKAIRIGESIAVNGVCLTVIKKSPHSFETDVMLETLKSTTLGELRLGSPVNLERSLKFGDLVGGHLVSGHVDGVGCVERIEKDGENQLWTFSCPESLSRFIALKGSVAIDGISLTVQDVKELYFKIGLIPHTLKVTNLGTMKAGTKVNIEVDLFARYLERVLSVSGHLPKGAGVHMRDLKQQGF